MRFRKTHFAWLPTAVVVLTSGFGGCTDAFVTDIDVPLPDAGEELVIEATLRPDDTSYVYVTRPIALNGGGDVVGVPDASVSLRIDGATVATFEEVERKVTSGSQHIFYDGSEDDLDSLDAVSVYLAVLPDELFAPGKVFELEVTPPGGESTTARQPVPTPGDFRSITLSEREFEVSIGFTIEDAPGGGAYMMEGEQIYYTRAYDSTGQDAGQLDSSITDLRFSTGDEFDYVDYDTRFYTRDGGFEGGAAAFRLDTYLPSSCSGCDDVPNSRLVLAFRTVNPLAVEYYDALRSLYDSKDNPFVEPVVIPSAFEGGRGMLIVQSRATVVDLEVQ